MYWALCILAFPPPPLLWPLLVLCPCSCYLFGIHSATSDYITSWCWEEAAISVVTVTLLGLVKSAPTLIYKQAYPSIVDLPSFDHHH
ncbi:hypothetical protein XENTR_v10016815 [Xenopus tropicalis]|nr:hypothetical protein XENTR_v10016815 [Xenopus tropicalis]